MVQPEHGLYPAPYFRKKLVQERKRAERSNRPVIVMLLDLGQHEEVLHAVKESLTEQLNTCIRETDVLGEIDGDHVFGVILTEVEVEMVETAKRAVALKIRERLATLLPEEVVRHMVISFKIFPENGERGICDTSWYPDATEGVDRGWEIAKRSLDLVGSLFGLVLCSPLFVVLPIFIKLSSRGPVFFRQKRVGRNGRQFELLKFRSMYLNNDDVVHRSFVQQLIRDKSQSRTVYKIQRDPRVTPIGRWLRKYSVDEVPQFINVLKGDMSLVGPRPPILYEVENYFLWQRRRLMGKKPGITGLWQVTGRSTTSFDDMVRLDLRYMMRWSMLLDVKILLRTPLAVFRCKGAY